MEEEKKDLTKAEATGSKKAKASDEKKHRSLKSVWAIYKGEFDKIIWPSWTDLRKKTFTVIVTSLMVGAIIACMDYAFRYAYIWMLQMVTKS